MRHEHMVLVVDGPAQGATAVYVKTGSCQGELLVTARRNVFHVNIPHFIRHLLKADLFY